MRLYHATTKAAAHSILGGGFEDRTGTYLTTTEHTGVWFADRPLDINDMGGDGYPAIVLTVDLDVPDQDLRRYEWVEDLKTYREFLLPAELVNREGTIVAVEYDEMDEDLDWWAKPLPAAGCGWPASDCRICDAIEAKRREVASFFSAPA